jgi:lysine-arginine-ornithine-binding protein
MHKRRFARSLLTLALLLLPVAGGGGGAAAKEWTEINIGVEGAFPPYNSLSADGKLSGYDIDVANEVCRRANLKCNLIAQDWDSQIPSLIAGKFDAVLTMGPNPKRREVIEFTVPYAQTSNTFGVLKSGPLAKLPNTGEALSVDEPAGRSAIEALKAALKGKTVGVALSTSQQQFVEEAFKGVDTVRTYKTWEQHTLDLLAGRVDAVFDNIVYLRDAVECPSNQDLTVAGPLVKGGVMATDTCIGVRKGEADLKAQLDKAIQAAIADGTVRTLAMKWFKLDVSPKS